MPFAGYGDFASCVSANQSKNDPEAYCGAIKHRVENKAADVAILAEGIVRKHKDRRGSTEHHKRGAQAVAQGGWNKKTVSIASYQAGKILDQIEAELEGWDLDNKNTQQMVRDELVSHDSFLSLVEDLTSQRLGGGASEEEALETSGQLIDAVLDDLFGPDVATQTTEVGVERGEGEDVAKHTTDKPHPHGKKGKQGRPGGVKGPVGFPSARQSLRSAVARAVTVTSATAVSLMHKPSHEEEKDD